MGKAKELINKQAIKSKDLSVCMELSGLAWFRFKHSIYPRFFKMRVYNVKHALKYFKSSPLKQIKLIDSKELFWNNTAERPFFRSEEEIKS